MVETATAPSATVATGHHPDAPVLELNGVGHEYGSGTPWATTALRDITFTVHEGEGVLIHGLNGSGKSTLAWIMAGLTLPTAGTCLLDGKPVSDQVGAVAISFQASRLQLMRSRVDLEIASAAGFSVRDRDRVIDALATVGLDPALAKRRIDQLSGGQMRRVVLAGLLARSPRVLILDEPLAGLDAASQRGLVRLLEELRRRAGLTVVVISHDFSGLEESVPAHASHAGRGAGTRADGRGRHVMTAPATARRPRKPVVLLRPVPGRSVIHELWAGTKLIAVAGIGVLMTFYPGWVPIGMVAALVLTTAWLAHIPRGALPSIPGWLWILLTFGCVTATFAGEQPGHRPGFDRGRAGRPFQLPAHHRAVDRAARTRRHGVVDDQRRRDRARSRHIGTTPARAADTDRRLGSGTGAGTARLSDADRRVPRVVRGAQAAAERAADDAARPSTAVGAGDHRSARGGHHRCAAAGRRDGRRDYRTRRRRSDLGDPVTARDVPTGLRWRSCSCCAAWHWGSSSRCWAPAASAGATGGAARRMARQCSNSVPCCETRVQRRSQCRRSGSRSAPEQVSAGSHRAAFWITRGPVGKHVRRILT